MVLVSPVNAPSHITDAIRKASEATGTDFDYLLTTAARESSFEPRARAKTSSAAGLFQFIESTWLQTVKEQGGRFGLQKYSPHIFRTESGRFYVPNKAIRDEILELRHNPEVSALMAGAFTQENAKYVSSRLGRDPTQGELYIAHFLGAGGATKLITLASKDPNARADTHFPRAAKANRSIFYSHRQARSVRQVYDQLVSDHSRLEATMLAVSTPGQSRSATAMKAAARPDASLNMSVVGAPGVSVPGSGWSERFPSFDPLAAVAPLARTRVAALGHSPVPMQGETMTDAGMGGIGPWHTIVQPESAAGSPQGQASAPGLRPSAEAQAGEPRRVRLQTRLHGAPPPPEPNPVTAGAGASASSTSVEPQTGFARDFANRFWELQALGGG